MLLGVTVALLTARMLAPGEDPGMLLPTSGPTNLVLPLCWFLAAVGLAGWRLGSRRGDWRGGVVEAGLLLAVLLGFAAAELAGYKHPARIIAWDGLTLFLVVCLVRLLAVSSSDRQALFAVFLAGAGALAAQAVYQAAVRSPASAAFAQPAPFAAWLALFLPGLFAAAYVCRPRRAAAWQSALAAVFGLLGVIAFVAAVVSAFQAPDAVPPLPDLWSATGKMILAHPLGVGPGNFSRAFPLDQGPGGGAVVTDPHNFLLEIAATGGVVALLAVLAALGMFFVKAARRLRQPSQGAGAEVETGPNELTRWEFYIGGMCGLVLGFIIRQTTGDRTGDDILREGFIACVRCLVWLTAFVLFERVPWSGRVRLGALTAGAAALLLMLMVSPGAGLPSVSVPLWAVVALALNELPAHDYPRVNRLALTRILPFFATVLVVLLYFLDIFVPVTSCSARLQTAVRDSRVYLRDAMQKDPNVLNDQRLPAFLQASPLSLAAQDDPDDARVPVMQSRWAGELWTFRPLIDPQFRQELQLPSVAVGYAQKAQKLDPQGRDGYYAEYQFLMEVARILEGFHRLPATAAGIGPGYRLFFTQSRWPHPLGRGAIERLVEQKDAHEPAFQFMGAADALERYLPHDPNDAVLRFRLAEARYKAWEDDRCREQAAEALRLNAAAPRPPLTDEQRQKLNVWKDLPTTK